MSWLNLLFPLGSSCGWRKRLLLGVGFSAFLLWGVLALWQTAPKHRINLESYNMIRAGMTADEVEGLIGVPAGDSTNGLFDLPPCGTGLDTPSEFYGPLESSSEVKEWKGSEGVVYLVFNSDRRVVLKAFFPVMRTYETLPEKVLRWLSAWTGFN